MLLIIRLIRILLNKSIIGNLVIATIKIAETLISNYSLSTVF